MGSDGVLYQGFAKPRELEASTLFLLTTLAGLAAMGLQVVAALEEKSQSLAESELMRRELEEWTRQLVAVNRYSSDCVGELDAAQVLETLVQHLPDLTEPDDWLLLRNNPEGDQEVVQASRTGYSLGVASEVASLGKRQHSRTPRRQPRLSTAF